MLARSHDDMTEQVVKQLDATELIQKLHDFFQQQYYAALVEQARKGQKWLLVDFADLSKFDPDIADALLERGIRNAVNLPSVDFETCLPSVA